MSTDNTEQALPPLGEEIEHAIGATSPHLLALAKRYAANTVHSYLFAVEAEAIVRRAVRAAFTAAPPAQPSEPAAQEGPQEAVKRREFECAAQYSAKRQFAVTREWVRGWDACLDHVEEVLAATPPRAVEPMQALTPMRDVLEAVSRINSFREFNDYLPTIRAYLAQHHAPDSEAQMASPQDGMEFWLWKNGDHFLAFRHLYPCFTPGGDPMVLGEPVGRAVFRSSHDRAARSIGKQVEAGSSNVQGNAHLTAAQEVKDGRK